MEFLSEKGSGQQEASVGDGEFCVEHKERKGANIFGEPPMGQLLF